jgi:hypothetical protein
MAFLIHGIDPALFAPWFALSDAELAARGARRRIADDTSGFPCRVSLAEPELGEELLLVPFEHHPVHTPYRGAGPIWVRRAARTQLVLDRVPELLAVRLLSVRAYDEAGMMATADVVDGREVAPHLERVLDRRDVAYVHVHYAKPGCFACRVTRRR